MPGRSRGVSIALGRPSARESSLQDSQIARGAVLRSSGLLVAVRWAKERAPGRQTGRPMVRCCDCGLVSTNESTVRFDSFRPIPIGHAGWPIGLNAFVLSVYVVAD